MRFMVKHSIVIARSKARRLISRMPDMRARRGTPPGQRNSVPLSLCVLICTLLLISAVLPISAAEAEPAGDTATSATVHESAASQANDDQSTSVVSDSEVERLQAA